MNTTDNDQFLTILEAPILPPLGKVPGIITDLAVETGADAEGKTFKRLKMTGDLNAKTEAGTPFKAARIWNLLGRGAKDFCKEVSSFTGRKITTNELRRFEKSALVNQPAVFEVKERKVGRQVSIYFAGFSPASSGSATQQ